MLRSITAAALLAAALGTVAGPAAAVRECDLGDVNCYRNCYLPYYDKPSGQLIWPAC